MKLQHRTRRYWRLAIGFLFFGISTTVLFSQTSVPWFRAKDPGPRPNPVSTIPSPVPGLSFNEITLFNESLLRVSELEGTCDTCSQQPQNSPPIDPDPRPPFSLLKLVNSRGPGFVILMKPNPVSKSDIGPPPVLLPWGGQLPRLENQRINRLSGTNLLPEGKAMLQVKYSAAIHMVGLKAWPQLFQIR